MGLLIDAAKTIGPHLLPPTRNASERKIRIWRWIITAFVVLTLLVFLWFVGAFPFASGVAFADDVEQQIEQALIPITDRLTGIETEQTVQGGYLKTLVKSDLRDDINGQLRARCKLTGLDDDDDTQKDLINAAIETYQEQFEDVAGHRYDEPDCDGL